MVQSNILSWVSMLCDIMLSTSGLLLHVFLWQWTFGICVNAQAFAKNWDPWNASASPQQWSNELGKVFWLCCQFPRFDTDFAFWSMIKSQIHRQMQRHRLMTALMPDIQIQKNPAWLCQLTSNIEMVYIMLLLVAVVEVVVVAVVRRELQCYISVLHFLQGEVVFGKFGLVHRGILSEGLGNLLARGKNALLESRMCWLDSCTTCIITWNPHSFTFMWLAIAQAFQHNTVPFSDTARYVHHHWSITHRTFSFFILIY